LLQREGGKQSQRVAHACSLAGAMLLMLNPTPLSAAFALGLSTHVSASWLSR